MAGIQNIPLRIPREWSPEWFDTFVREVLAKMDTRNAVGNGVTVSSNGNSVATIDAELTQDNIDDAIADHEAAANPHPTYLTEAEADALYADISHTHTGSAITTLIIENRTDDPGSPETGRIWLRTDL